MAQAQPVAIDGVTYPSKQAASYALRERGLDWQTIVDKVGTTLDGAKVGHRTERKRLAGQPGHSPELQPGIWTPEKRDKVQRLFGLTMIEIADAVAVPPAELLKYVLHGVVPPSQAVRDISDIDWRGAANVPQAQLAPPAEPGRDDDDMQPPAICRVEPSDERDREDDEAEIAALAAHGPMESAIMAPEAPAVPAARFQPPATPAPARPVAQPGKLIPVAGGLFPAGCIVRLVRDDGQYLHESLQAFTKKIEHAWDGTRQQFDAVKAQMPKIVAKLSFEVVP
jgi:hypothetical protein